MADNQINMINLNEIFQDVKTDQIRQLLNETKDSKTCMWYLMCALDGMNDNELLKLAGYTIPQIKEARSEYLKKKYCGNNTMFAEVQNLKNEVKEIAYESKAVRSSIEEELEHAIKNLIDSKDEMIKLLKYQKVDLQRQIEQMKSKVIQLENQKKETKLLEHRFIELSRIAFEREIVTYSDFLNLNDQNILHTMPKNRLYSRYVLFGGYDMAERQMAAFIPEALSLRYGVSDITPKEIDYPFCAVKIEPKNKRFSEDLTHRDFLGSILNLGIDRSKTGDILVTEDSALLFINKDLVSVVTEDLTRVRHTVIDSSVINLDMINYTPDFQQIKGTVSSVRLDSLLPLAFSSSRSKLSGLIEGAKVFVNGKLITSNGYQVKEGDLISVRGLGKFRFEEAGKITKKNRISVTIQKYV